jgi:hypothetical protein
MTAKCEVYLLNQPNEARQLTPGDRSGSWWTPLARRSCADRSAESDAIDRSPYPG